MFGFISDTVKSAVNVTTSVAGVAVNGATNVVKQATSGNPTNMAIAALGVVETAMLVKDVIDLINDDSE